MEFKRFGVAVAKQFQQLTATELFRTKIDGNALWEAYLASFPPGTNPIFKTRTEHDCSCCRHFVKTLGGVVAIRDGILHTIWDIQSPVDDGYLEVARRMADLVRSQEIDNMFVHTERTVGVLTSHQLLESKDVRTWDHFFVNLPPRLVKTGTQIGPITSQTRSTYDVLMRSLNEITLESLMTVLELIDQNSLYRGEEQRHRVEQFRQLKCQFDRLSTAQDLFVWGMVTGISPDVSHIRNTAIGTLLVDLSDGKDLEDAVKSFEVKVAPTNYKRPTALVTKAQVQRAQAAVEELGLTSALERRFATIEDITINNVLFADRAARHSMNVFDKIAQTAPSKQQLGREEEVPIDDFLTNVLPRAESIELFLENRHVGNLVSLIAPADPTAKRLFKWDNGFSWAYNGDVADSIKERVKRAGGQVDADLRCSLSWFNYDDLDLHLMEPGGHFIYFRDKRNPLTGGALDVDMNAGSGTTREAVENIRYPDRRRMLEGEYQLFVHNFSQRETQDVGFEVEMEFCGGTVHTFAYPRVVRNDEKVLVARFTYSHKDGINITESLPSSTTSKRVWGIPTQAFHRVSVIMLSPNHWDGHPVGNRHYFFMIGDCRRDGTARGFFNEFLAESLNPHRKVLELVGSRMRTEETDRQLSGLGFSSTLRNSVLCRVKGSFTRTVKVLF